MSDRLLCAFTPTCNRPELLGRMIRCFMNQTYENRYLVILDDLGQFDNQDGDRWSLVSIPRRFLSLGEKNNAVVALAPRDTYGLLKMDDDDLYHPWYFSAMDEALQASAFVQPRLAIDTIDGARVITKTYSVKDKNNVAYHGQWGFRRSFFKLIGGYRAEYAGDDGELQRRVKSEHPQIEPGDVDWSRWKPFYEYNRPLPGRISERGGSAQAYWDSAPTDPKWIGKVIVPDKVEYPPIPTTETVERKW